MSLTDAKLPSLADKIDSKAKAVEQKEETVVKKIVKKIKK